MDEYSLGKQIEKHRKDQKYTAVALGRVVGVSSGFIRDIERGKKFPSLPVLCSIANTLNVSVDELLCNSLHGGNMVVLNDITNKMKLLTPKNLSIVSNVVNVLIDSLIQDQEI